MIDSASSIASSKSIIGRSRTAGGAVPVPFFRVMATSTLRLICSDRAIDIIHLNATNFVPRGTFRVKHLLARLSVCLVPGETEEGCFVVTSLKTTAVISFPKIEVDDFFEAHACLWARSGWARFNRYATTCVAPAPLS
ncbi:MAG: hypothetical protein IKL97_03760, partial [Eggerthellaceae bacterium]|nr:hypothetical protein [Eggerthellaceae bacterium]